MKNIWEKGKWEIWYVLLIAGVVSVPLMTNYVLGGSELASTLSRIEVMSKGIGKVFPLRMVPWGTMDYGYAAASFQADVFYLLPVLMRLAGMGVGNAYKWTLLLYNIGTAAIACFCFARCCGRREAGMAAGMLYTWCPYRLSEMYLVGSLGETAAWMCFPILVLGLKLLYTEDRKREQDGWLCGVLTLGYSLLLLSSTAVWFVAMVMTVLLVVCMGKKTLQRRTLRVIGKTIAAFAAVNAWFLLPMLARMTEASAVEVLVAGDFRGMGMYPIQYLTVFYRGGDGVNLLENGMYHAMGMGPGIAVVLLVFLWLWVLFTGQRGKSQKPDFTGRMLCISGIMMFLGSNLCPWDLLQNQNRLCSVLLALLCSPAKFGICACAGLVFTACVTLVWVAENNHKKVYQVLLLLVTAVAFAATQFLSGNILRTRGFAKGADIEALSSVPLSLVSQESVSWRICEVISVAALCGGVAAWVIRRRRHELCGRGTEKK